MDLALLQWLTAGAAFVFFATATVLRSMAPDEASLRLWQWAGLLFTGAQIAGALRNTVPMLPAVEIGNVLASLGAVYVFQGTRVLLGRAPIRYLWLPVAVFAVAVSTYYTAVQPDIVARVMLLSPIGAACFAGSAWLFWHHREALLGNGTKAISGLYSGVALLYALRAALAPVGMTSQDYSETDNWAVAGIHAIAIVFFGAAAVALTWVVSTRQRRELDQARQQAEAANEQLLAMTWTDPLTGVANRARIASLLDSEVAMSALGADLIVLLIALDSRTVDFDPRTAERDLITIAEAACERLQLTEPVVDTVGRWGDDSLLLLLPDTDEGRARRFAELLHSDLPAGTRCTYALTRVRTADSPDEVLGRLNEGRYTALAIGSGWIETV